MITIFLILFHILLKKIKIWAFDIEINNHYNVYNVHFRSVAVCDYLILLLLYSSAFYSVFVDLETYIIIIILITNYNNYIN
jgi:hypothetical protein